MIMKDLIPGMGAKPFVIMQCPSSRQGKAIPRATESQCFTYVGRGEVAPGSRAPATGSPAARALGGRADRGEEFVRPGALEQVGDRARRQHVVDALAVGERRQRDDLDERTTTSPSVLAVLRRR